MKFMWKIIRVLLCVLSLGILIPFLFPNKKTDNSEQYVEVYPTVRMWNCSEKQVLAACKDMGVTVYDYSLEGLRSGASTRLGEWGLDRNNFGKFIKYVKKGYFYTYDSDVLMLKSDGKFHRGWVSLSEFIE